MSEPTQAQNQEKAGGNGREQAHDQGSDNPPLLEWLLAALGFLLVAGSLGYIAYQAITDDNLPPDVIVRVEDMSELGDHYLVRFAALNEGGATAAGLTVTGALTRDGETIEETSTTISYVPPQSYRAGGLYFRRDPRDYELQLTVSGYEEP